MLNSAKKGAGSRERMHPGQMVEFHHIPPVEKKQTCLYGNLPIDWEVVGAVNQTEVVGAEAEAASLEVGTVEADNPMGTRVDGKVLTTEIKEEKGNQRQCSSHSHHPLLPYFLPLRRHYHV